MVRRVAWTNALLTGIFCFQRSDWSEHCVRECFGEEASFVCEQAVAGAFSQSLEIAGDSDAEATIQMEEDHEMCRHVAVVSIQSIFERQSVQCIGDAHGCA